MKISELIAQLQTSLADHGDLPVVLCDADTEWLWEVMPDDIVWERHDDRGPMLQICMDYGHEPWMGKLALAQDEEVK